MFKIPECIHIEPTQTPTPKMTKIPASPFPTDTFSPSISPSTIVVLKSPTPSPTESPTKSSFITNTQIPLSITNEPEPVITDSPSSSSDSGNDNHDGIDKDIIKKPWFIALIVSIAIALIIAFVTGWFISKSCHNRDERSMRLNTSESFHSTLLSD